MGAFVSVDQDSLAIAERCHAATYDGSLTFPAIAGTLIDGGFEGYMVDFRRDAQIYYLAEGGSVELAIPPTATAIAPALVGEQVQALVRWVQSASADYSFAAFSEKVRAAGCAGYLVSFTGRRVVYFGRTAETHVEYFPQ